MITFTSAGGTIWPKWMQKPCANSTVEPGRSAGATMSSQTCFWTWSGTKMPITSAPCTASAGDCGVQPCDSARRQPSEPGRTPTVTLAPDSFRFSAWAWPWEP